MTITVTTSRSPLAPSHNEGGDDVSPETLPRCSPDAVGLAAATGAANEMAAVVMTAKCAGGGESMTRGPTRDVH